MSVQRVLLVGSCSLVVAAAAWAGTSPVAVSPGDPANVVLVESRCPTFNWGEVEGTQSYELVVYRIGEQGKESAPVLQQTIAGAALGWTPPLERCLERGGKYAWTVRAVGVQEASRWSQPSLFQVAAGPSQAEFEEALAIVRAYLADQGGPDARGDSAARIVSPSEANEPSEIASAKGPERLAPAGTQLSVDGNVDAVSFTGDGSALTSVGADTLDGLDSISFLRSDAADSFTSGTLTTGLGTTLDVNGSLDASGATALSLPASGITGAGPGSGFDADTIDTLDSTAFMPVATDKWVNEAGDTMTGDLDMGGNDINELGVMNRGGMLFLHDNGHNITARGRDALANNTTGHTNTATGAYALRDNTSGNSNTATGAKALYSNLTGQANTATGAEALRDNADGFKNTAIGRKALLSNSSGSRNVAVGGDALRANTLGNYNVAVGAYALRDNTEGGSNIAVGPAALETNTTGYLNTAMGDGALRANTLGYENAAFGNYALNSNTTGSRNVAVGPKAMYSNTTGHDNTAIGNRGLYHNLSGSHNTAVGDRAATHATGSHNVSLGFGAGSDVTGNNNIMISNAGYGGDSETIRIGAQGTQTTAYLAGIYGSPLAGSAVVVTSSGQLGVASGATGNADTLDGLDSAQFLRSDTSNTFTSGTLTFSPLTGLDIDGGLDVSGASVQLPTGGTISGAGSGSGLDADTVDGLDSTDFLRSNTASTLTAALTVTTGGSLSTTGGGTIAASTASALSINGLNCATGTWPAGVDAAGNVESCTADDDQPDSDAEVPDSITIAGGSVSNSAVTVVGSLTPTPTTEGRLEWDTDDDRLAVGDGSASVEFYPGAGRYALSVKLQDISIAGSAWVAVPEAGTVTAIYSVIDGGIATSDATLTPRIGGTPITDGAITVTSTGSVAGDVDSSNPTAANSVSAGDAIEIATDGASTGSVAATLTLLVTRS